jgi:hypothetical protein
VFTCSLTPHQAKGILLNIAGEVFGGVCSCFMLVYADVNSRILLFGCKINKELVISSAFKFIPWKVLQYLTIEFYCLDATSTRSLVISSAVKLMPWEVFCLTLFDFFQSFVLIHYKFVDLTIKFRTVLPVPVV